MKFIGAALFTFFMGAVPYSYIVGRVTKHIDIREYGSKNPGAGNVFHLVSWRAGTIALILDAGKGLLALYILWYFFKFTPVQLTYLGMIAVLGHVLSPFLQFKGGKGAATAGGVLIFVISIVLGTRAIAFLIYFIIPWVILLVLAHSQVVSLAILLPFLPVVMWFMTRDIKLTIALILFSLLIELLGVGSLRREWRASYEKYLKRYFKK